MNPIQVVGVGMGLGDMSEGVLEIVRRAQVLAGGRRLLDLFPDHPAERLVLSGGLDAWIDRLAALARRKKAVALASGDPGFFGVGARLAESLGRENVVIHPNVTAVQAAFARLGRPWQDAAAVSLHGRDADALFAALQGREWAAVYSDPRNTPARMARLLLERDQPGWRMWVLEEMGSANERVGCYDLADAARRDFDPLNLAVLERTEPVQHLRLGAPDHAYEHQDGLITKPEVRAAILAKLELGPGLTIWDLGAGCGSVGLEALLLAPGGRAAAVERQPERVRCIRTNRRRYGAAALEVVQGEALEVMDGLPDPDRVFIGGGGPDLEAIIRAAAGRLRRGVMTVSAIRLEAMETARRTMADLGLECDLTHLQVSRGAPLAGGVYMKPLNPIWLVTGRKA